MKEIEIYRTFEKKTVKAFQTNINRSDVLKILEFKNNELCTECGKPAKIFGDEETFLINCESCLHEFSFNIPTLTVTAVPLDPNKGLSCAMNANT